MIRKSGHRFSEKIIDKAIRSTPFAKPKPVVMGPGVRRDDG